MVHLHLVAYAFLAGGCPPLLKRRGRIFIVIKRIISIGRLEATADADGDIGRSSQLDHLKELDLYFSELYWSSFLGAFQKNRYRNRIAYRGGNVFVCFRTEIESAHANRLFITELPPMIGTVFLWKKNVLILVGHNSGPKSQIATKKFVTFLSQFRNCDFGPELCPTKIRKFFSP